MRLSKAYAMGSQGAAYRGRYDGTIVGKARGMEQGGGRDRDGEDVGQEGLEPRQDVVPQPLVPRSLEHPAPLAHQRVLVSCQFILPPPCQPT